MNLIDIIHVRKIAADTAQTKMMEEVFTDEQKIKLATIESLINEIGEISVDTELDATITALTEIRDK
ncbi:MAG: hypothetical protein CMO16_03690 [Thaumarchaeota archaeon]|nr:hypothetical protein [Nitrososphaerota archaeon]|tara:strand:+ start:92 stop:292 length:201 start_codon:yes stop_codon:yes gene_type:complete